MKEPNMSICQEIFVSASPAQVFEVFTQADAFTRMSGGAPAEIDAADGGAFSLFGGAIHGRNVECVPGTRVVQAWRTKAWKPGQYSFVRFDLRPEGDGTRVSLEHVGYPEEQREHLVSGWQANYMEPLRKLFA
jgi:activator of HSP90 ATPase